ncbi:MAG TPA: M3 family oligoendopeptidase [Dictyobacter sp.]|jgi:oligoendopeptidase F|nr:M3 family oligoendopeptidase [Dictyobacter sp.]
MNTTYSLLPKTSEAFEQLAWSEIEPYYQELAATSLSAETLSPWLTQWSDLNALVDETLMRFEIATTRNIADQEIVQRQQHFLDAIYTQIQPQEQQLQQQLLDSGLEPAGFAVPLRIMHAEGAIFSEANLPLLNQERQLNVEYNQIIGSQMVTWEGEEVSTAALFPMLGEPSRERREQAWRTVSERRLVDRERLNTLWTSLVKLRQQIAQQAGYKNYREYSWQKLHRFDYTPEDCEAFHATIEQIIVPAASRIWEKRRQRLGIETLRPWDEKINPQQQKAPRRITDIDALLHQCHTVFNLVDPQLGSYFATMIKEQIFDLDDRPNKAPGGYNLALEVKRKPFIFGRALTVDDSLDLIFHEAGHAFHVLELLPIQYMHQRKEAFLPIEFAEVASTSMEYIGAMHLQQAGICTETEALQMRIQHLENTLLHLFPMIAQGDAFQHWVYTHPEQASDPVQCNQKWAELTQRFHPDIDWSGLDSELESDWQRILHFFGVPFYYIEYAFAGIGALQVWRNYLQDPQAAIQQYRHGLSLGTTRTLPELFEAAGARFTWDANMVQSLVDLIMHTIEELEAKAATV